jgi:formylglycine-generating enzyme required for sulfatase activity
MNKTKYFWLAVTVIISLSFSLRKKFIPPGTVQITETFFADETEISNFSWWEYTYWTGKKYGVNSPEFKATLPDTSVWLDPSAYNKPYEAYYFRHPAYRNYPVVGISYEQALAFCKWRTERVKEYWYIKTKKELDIEYRLPTKEEWELISNSGMDVFIGNGKNSKGQYMFNCLSDSMNSSTRGIMLDNADVTAPVYSYWKNHFGLFQTIGNVAEMINEKGICKGGSWRHRPEACRAGNNIAYSKPTSWVGFRCVCVVNGKQLQ